MERREQAYRKRDQDDPNEPSVVEIISNMIRTLSRFEIISGVKKFTNDLEILTTKPELQEVKKEYFQAYTMTCWNYIWKSLLYYLLVATILVFAGYGDEYSYYFIFPLSCMGYVANNIYVQRTRRSDVGLILYYCFFSCIITNMSVSKSSYEYHEGWGVMNMVLFIIVIAFCLEWKIIIKVFLLCRLYYVANIYYYYGALTFMQWFCFVFEFLCVCIIITTLSKIYLSFIEMNIKIKHLLKTIRKLLEVFPESVMIEAFDPQLKQNVMRFINNAAKKEFSIDNQDQKSLLNPNMNFKISEKFEKHTKESSNISEILRNHAKSVKETNQEISSEIKVARTDSDEKYFTVKTIMVEWEEDKQACMHVFTDMTHVKNLEHEKAINKCLHLMFSSVSHEFRTPLNAFKHSIGFMKNSYQNLQKLAMSNRGDGRLQESDEMFNKFHKIASISSTTLLSLVEDILDLAKIKSGTFSLNINSFRLRELMNEIDYIFGFQCTQKKLDFEISYTNCCPETIAVSDVGRVKQILINLISNCFKFTQRGSISVKISELRELEMETFESHSYFKFIVEDTGIGIAKENQKNLFQIFGKLDQDDKNINDKGTGLGLNICKKLVEALGGTIELTSEETKGTEVAFTIRNQVEHIPPSRQRPMNHQIQDISHSCQSANSMELTPHTIREFLPNPSCLKNNPK
ncbi:unnamed protein product [Moneuplotes crassus]|uniref:Histidine kinase domain-containing protein n=1 Tax=Euplotes crassus TaxID=5936 RepID=A0AAD1Y4K2_EUPCR|nr:unnamed protein product [Moneuplotes crassus]